MLRLPPPHPESTEIIFPFRNPGLKIQALPTKPPSTTMAVPFSFRAPPSCRRASSHEFELTTYYPAALPAAFLHWTECRYFPQFMRSVRGSCRAQITEPSWRLRLREGEVPWEGITIENLPGKRISWWSTGSGSHRNRGYISFSSGGWRTTKITLKIEFYESSTRAVTEETMRALREGLDRALDLLHSAASTGPVFGPMAVSL
jgi:hypothetical protein